MAKETLLDKLERAVRARKIEKFTKESYEWFQTEARKLAGGSLKDRITKDYESQGRFVRGNPKDIHIGAMLMYSYYPKWAKELPYFDKFPLGILLSVERDRFQCFNLHFVPPKYRAALFDALLTILNNKRFDDSTKFRLTYNMVKSMKSLSILKHCYREYLFSHVRSRVIKVQPKDWDKVIFLPLQNFEKSVASAIWSDINLKNS